MAGYLLHWTSDLRTFLSPSSPLSPSPLPSPPPPKIGTSHGKLGNFGSELTKSTSPARIGTSYGRIRDFGFELTKNSTTQNWNFIWKIVQKIGVWRLLLYPPPTDVI